VKRLLRNKRVISGEANLMRASRRGMEFGLTRRRRLKVVGVWEIWGDEYWAEDVES